MNLFENLQALNESENKLVSEFKEFLVSKNAQYIANEIGETKDGMQLVIYDGDWKHEHRYMQNLIDEFFKNKGINIEIYSEEIGESDSDTFSARYDIEFNAEPKTYNADVKQLKFTTEDIEDSYDNNGILTELRTGIGPHNELRYEIYQDGTLMFHSTNKELAKEKFKEISTRVSKEYKLVDGKYKKFSPEGNAGLVDIWNSETESVNEVIEPSNFSPDGRSYYDDPSDWKEKHEWVTNKLEAAGYKCKGQSPWKSIWTNGNPKEDIEIDYWMDFDVIQEIVELSTVGFTESVDASNWKQKNNEDTYVSDKYSEYIIKKSITSSEQEVWSVLNSKTQREVFAAGTFEDAIDYVENKSTSKTITEDVDWKPRFNTMDNYFVSDKYPTYQINKSYNGFGKEIWAVIKYGWNGMEEKRVFIGSTFEQAKDFVENKCKSIKEAPSYGGAFDISDTVYFTKDDLDEFTNDIVEKLSDATHGDVVADIIDSYIDEDTNEIEVTISYNNYEHTHKEKIDMRKIKVPKDLIKAYSHKFVNDFLWCINADTEHEEMLKESNDINLDDYEYVGYGSGHNRLWQLYRRFDKELNKGVWVAKHQNTGEIKSITYDQAQGFEPIEDSGVVRLSRDLGRMLLPKRESNEITITFEDIRNQLEKIDTHPYLTIYYDYNPFLNTGKVTIEGTLINGNPICFYDSSFLKTQDDIDFIKEQYAKASKEIDAMRKRGYLGVKDESIEEDYDDNAATFLDKLEAEVKEAAHNFMVSVGFPENEADDYIDVSTDINDDYVMVAVGAELGYDSLSDLCDELNKVIEKHDEDAYFEPECPGRIVAYLFGVKEESLTETNHIIIEETDYAIGEKLFNEMKDYLDSLDQIEMDGHDWNWQPSEFNAKTLEPDGEIYLVGGAYILFYPYINEWSDSYFKVAVVNASELNIMIKNGIENIFNKFKTDKWQLTFEN